MRVLKSYAVESLEDQGFAELTRQAGERNMAVARIDAKFDPVIYLCIGCSYFLAVAGGSALVLQDKLTLGELTSFTMYLGQLIWPMFAIAWLFNIIERGSAAYSRIESMLGSAATSKSPPGLRPLSRLCPLRPGAWAIGWSSAACCRASTLPCNKEACWGWWGALGRARAPCSSS